jgi:hypothetical protein
VIVLRPADMKKSKQSGGSTLSGTAEWFSIENTKLQGRFPAVQANCDGHLHRSLHSAQLAEWYQPCLNN